MAQILDYNKNANINEIEPLLFANYGADLKQVFVRAGGSPNPITRIIIGDSADPTFANDLMDSIDPSGLDATIAAIASLFAEMDNDLIYYFKQAMNGTLTPPEERKAFMTCLASVVKMLVANSAYTAASFDANAPTEDW